MEEKSFRELLNEPAHELSLTDKVISYTILIIFGYTICSTLFSLI